MADFEGVRLHDNKGVDKLVFATGLEVGTFSYIGYRRPFCWWEQRGPLCRQRADGGGP